MVSFHDMYQKYGLDVYRYAFWLCRNRHDAEDIASETFVRAWAGSGRLHAETLKGYLLTIARNIWLDQLARQKRMAPEPEDITDQGENPQEHAMKNEETAMVNRAISRLKDSDRQVLFLRYSEGLSCREIADCLGITLSSVKVSLHRARKRLGARIQEES